MFNALAPTSVLMGLIEAYWNVNGRSDRHAITAWSGLIEAYWNVNLLFMSSMLGLVRV